MGVVWLMVDLIDVNGLMKGMAGVLYCLPSVISQM